MSKTKELADIFSKALRDENVKKEAEQKVQEILDLAKEDQELASVPVDTIQAAAEDVILTDMCFRFVLNPMQVMDNPLDILQGKKTEIPEDIPNIEDERKDQLVTNVNSWIESKGISAEDFSNGEMSNEAFLKRVKHIIFENRGGNNV